MKIALGFTFGFLISSVVYFNLPDHGELKVGDCFSLLGLGLGKITKVNRETYEYRVKYAETMAWSLPDRDYKESSIFGPRVDCATYK